MATDSGPSPTVAHTDRDDTDPGREIVRIAAWTPPKFFDAAGGLPPSPSCVEWLTAAWRTAWADPAGRHEWAGRARAALHESRRRFAGILGCAADEVWFAPNPDLGLATAAAALVRGSRMPGAPIMASPLERLSLLRTLDALAAPAPVRTLAVNAEGLVDADDPALRAPASLIVLQAANREIGTKQPLSAIEGLQAPLLVDGTAVRRLADLPRRWDAIVLEPSTWGGPPGIAVVACRSSAPWVAQAPASTAERFPGRVAVPLAAAAAMAVPGSAEHEAEEQRIALLADHLAARIQREIPQVQRLGSPRHRLRHIVSLSVLYVQAEQLVDELARRGFSVHSGSACTSDTKRPSHVLTAIGALTHGNLRISLPLGCPRAEVDALATAVVALARAQRREAGVP
jgi:cysteine desulfurase